MVPGKVLSLLVAFAFSVGAQVDDCAVMPAASMLQKHIMKTSEAPLESAAATGLHSSGGWAVQKFVYGGSGGLHTKKKNASSKTSSRGSTTDDGRQHERGGQEGLSIQTMLCCFTTIACVFASAAIWNLHKNEQQASETPATRPSLETVSETGVAARATEAPVHTAAPARDCLLDNAKALAMVLVVMGHILIHVHLKRTTVMAMIKGVQMPLFSFVSGLCSQSAATPSRVAAFIGTLFLPFLLWTYVGFPLFVDPMTYTHKVGPKLSVLMKNLRRLVTLTSVRETSMCTGPWYLLALSVWRVGSLFIWPFFDATFVVFSMIGLSCVLGYYSLGTQACPGRVLDSAMGFLPYFVLGWAFPLKKATRTFKVHSSGGYALAAVLVLLANWLMACFERMVMLDKLPDAHEAYSSRAEGHGWEKSLFWTYRVTQIATDVLCIIPLLLFVIPRGETPLTWIGGGTLYVYLLHPLGAAAEPASSYLTQLEDWSKDDAVKQSVAIFVIGVYSIALTALFASRPVRWLFGWLVEPSWIQPVVQLLVNKPAPKT